MDPQHAPAAVRAALCAAPNTPCALQKRPGEYDPRGFKALDLVVETCRRRGLKLILSLIDNWKYYNGCAITAHTSAPFVWHRHGVLWLGVDAHVAHAAWEASARSRPCSR